jgi:lipoprotein-releasing system permease protein
MAINDKRSEIAILMSLGYNKRAVMQTFIVQGMLMGCVGVVIGSVVGVVCAIYLTQIVEFLQIVLGFKILNEEVYYISFIPSEFKYMDLLLVVSVTIVITFMSTIVPAFFATRIKPARELAGK